MTGKPAPTVSFWDTLRLTPDLTEPGRRKPWAVGSPVKLADGQAWMLATPTFRPRLDGLTRPAIDRPLDRIFEAIALDEAVSLHDVWQVAGSLLRANYNLSPDEVADLLSVEPGEECAALIDSVLDVLFGAEDVAKSYTDWVRASLLANGLGADTISAHDLADVLAILVATRRTVPVGQFTDACRAAEARSSLETLI